MRLKNGEVCLGWPLSKHILTQGWYYNDGSLHQAIDMRAIVGTPVMAAEEGTVEIVYHWNGKRTQVIRTATVTWLKSATRIGTVVRCTRCMRI